MDKGFRTEGELAVSDPVEYERMSHLKESRWTMGLDVLDTIGNFLWYIP